MSNDFFENLKSFMGEDFDELKSSFNAAPFRGIYINTLKGDMDKIISLLPYELRQTPFALRGYYIDNDIEQLGNNPLHHAGAFYAQEPSAMSAAAAINPQKGEKILDLCASPGGKSVNIAAMLDNTGFLWSNEYVKSRSKILLSNLERMGVRNGVVSNMSSEAIAELLPEFFDKVLVDAPCSGEGMFRREKASLEAWNIGNVGMCAQRQLLILCNAAKNVKHGGRLIYSTCTFNKTENEDVINAFLQANPDFSLINIGNEFGRPGYGVPEARRVFPMDGGEGHFVAVLERETGANYNKIKPFRAAPAPKEFYSFWQDNFDCEIFGNPCSIGDKVYLVPDDMPEAKGANILRAGVLAGRMKGKMFFPEHNLYTSIKYEDCKVKINLPYGSEELLKYLHGEEIDCPGQKGFCAVALEGIMLGFGKVSGGKLKNHYPKGLRNLK